MIQSEKWLLALTVVNFATAVLVIISIYAIWYALGAFAAEVSGWPLLVLLPVGILSSLTAVVVTKRASSGTARTLARFVNGSALALHSVVMAFIGVVFFSSTKERFIIPEGFMGDIYVIHNVVDGEREERTLWETTYRIPRNGILRSHSSVYRGLTRRSYYYQKPDGTLLRIQHQWYTSIHRTPENLQNDRDVGIFFPRSGTLQIDSSACPIEYEKFYVGTKSHLLSVYQETSLDAQVRDHPIECGQSTR